MLKCTLMDTQVSETISSPAPLSKAKHSRNPANQTSFCDKFYNSQGDCCLWGWIHERLSAPDTLDGYFFSTFKKISLYCVHVPQSTLSLQIGHRFSPSSHLSTHLEWYSCGQLGSFLVFWPRSKFSKHIEQASSVVSPRLNQTFSRIPLIYSSVNPLLTLPFLSSSSISCS